MMILVKTLQYCADTKRKSCAQYKESPIQRDRQLWKKWLQIHQLERPGLWKESPLHQVWQHLGHPALHPIPHHQVHHQVETLCPKNWTETLFLKVLSECLKAFGKIQKNSHLSGRYIWILFKKPSRAVLRSLRSKHVRGWILWFRRWFTFLRQKRLILTYEM